MKLMTEEQARRHLARAVKTAGTQRAFASKHRIAPQLLNDVVRGRRRFSPALCRALGMERCWAYRFKEK